MYEFRLGDVRYVYVNEHIHWTYMLRPLFSYRNKATFRSGPKFRSRYSGVEEKINRLINYTLNKRASKEGIILHTLSAHTYSNSPSPKCNLAIHRNLKQIRFEPPQQCCKGRLEVGGDWFRKGCSDCVDPFLDRIVLYNYIHKCTILHILYMKKEMLLNSAALLHGTGADIVLIHVINVVAHTCLQSILMMVVDSWCFCCNGRCYIWQPPYII